MITDEDYIAGIFTDAIKIVAAMRREADQGYDPTPGKTTSRRRYASETKR
jgi:hypothetical protein